MSNILVNFLPYFVAVLAICMTVGGFFAFRNGRQTQLTIFQENTNKAQKNRIDLLESRIDDLEKENVVQRHLIETLISAFKQRGMIVTIDGDMVIISDKSGTSTHRKRSTAHAPLAREKEENS